MTKPRVICSRKWPAPVEAVLRERFDVTLNEADVALSADPLKDALNRARQQEVERSDVIVDLREAEIARLELLQDALREVFDAVPDDNDLLDCALVPTVPPRAWATMA